MCNVMETIANESSNAYFKISSNPLTSCQRVFDCSVVIAPFTTGALGTGTGWMFQKRSPFLPIFRHYHDMIRESGTFWRLHEFENRPDFQSNYFYPEPICETHKGKPIGLYKISSIFVIVVIGIGIYFLIYV